MKKLVIILLVLLVVSMGGAGGLVMLGIVRNPFSPPQTAGETKPTGPEVSPAGIKVPTEALVLEKVPDMIVPVILQGGVQRRISVSVRLVTKNPVKGRVQDEMPKYQDALLNDMILYFQDYFARNKELDIETVRKRALAAAVKIYGEDVTDVLLVNVFDLGAAAAPGNFSPEN